ESVRNTAAFHHHLPITIIVFFCEDSQQQEDDDDSGHAKVASSAKPSSDDTHALPKIMPDQSAVHNTHPSFKDVGIISETILGSSSRKRYFATRFSCSPMRKLRATFAFPVSCVLSRKQGLWEEYVAKLTG
ncbi:unnamed protein product, partial [Ectocarpus sp. 13 AM-2016]